MSSTASVSHEENTELALFLLKQRLNKIHHILHEKLSIFSDIVQQSLFVDLDISMIDGRQTANSVSKNTSSNSIKQKLVHLKDQITKLNYSDVITLIDSAVEEQTLREQFFAKKRAQLSQPSQSSSLNLMTDKPKILPKIEYDEGNEFSSATSSSMIHKPSVFSKITREWSQETSFQPIKTPKITYSDKNSTSLTLKQSKLAFTKEPKTQHPKQSQLSYPFISKHSINPSENSFSNGSHLPFGLNAAPKKSSIILMTKKAQDSGHYEGNLKTKSISKSTCSSAQILPMSKSIKKDAQMKIQQKRYAQKENIDNNCNKDEDWQLQPKITRQSPMNEQRRKPLSVLRKKQNEEQAESQTSFFIEYLKDLIEQSTKCQLEVPKIFKSKQFYEQRCDPQFKSVGTRLSHKDKSFVVKLFKALDGKSLLEVHELLKLPPTLVSGLVLRAIKGEFDSDGNESNDEILKNSNSRDYGEEEEDNDDDGGNSVNYGKLRESYEENEENDNDYEEYYQGKEKQGKRLMFNF